MVYMFRLAANAMRDRIRSEENHPRFIVANFYVICFDELAHIFSLVKQFFRRTMRCSLQYF